MHKTEIISLASHSLATERSLTVHRFGKPGTRPKAYIQAGLHADELAANLTASHLGQLLHDANVAGEIVLVPLANPVGLSQVLSRTHLGRSDLATGKNYNRGHFNVTAKLAEETFTSAEEVRAAVGKALAATKPEIEADVLQHTLMTLAHDADIVLDLHTDSDAELHLYLDPARWPDAEDLAAWLGVPVVMLSRASGGDPFEEALTAPFVAAGIAPPLAVVVELRGRADAFDEFAEKDALALFRFLKGRGVVAGDPGPQPAFAGGAAPFEQTAFITAPVPGIIAYKKELGAQVEAGETVAEIVDVRALDGGRTPVPAPTSGRFFARSLHKLARPGMAVGKIFGNVPIKGREGYLLSD